MNTKIFHQIKNRLSLRKPQSDSLEIIAELADKLELKKDVDVVVELEKIKSLYPTCTDFERDFPSLCFALATGVGKTRLMGAFISYLYIAKGIKNFFVIAPNLTIYNKLIDDLSNPQSKKYVFKGISDFAIVKPRIVTGDNYAEFRESTGQRGLGFQSEVIINIFNISKINSEVRGGKNPKIKRLSEYLGESYFNYLSSLPDLVLLMDESHHYRAAAGLKAINELKPILGLELTATPIDTNGNKFKNVVYDYPLARALQDGFVKEPAVATRRNFNPDQYSKNPDELDQIKLEDGIRLHEDTKVALDIYSRDTGRKYVKPFVLVVAQHTEHASRIKDLIMSDAFFEGRYKDKVMEIHSNQRGEEKEENIQMLLSVEDPNNKIEIVIHVNMLKEGWDVTNLYTIVPLRTARSIILTEQTIGRGLRLPYGERTGDSKVDKLTIIAHDSFQAIVDEANNPNSIIRKENIIEIDVDAIKDTQEVVTVQSVFGEQIEKLKTAIFSMGEGKDKQTASTELAATTAVISTLENLSKEITNIDQLKTGEVQKIALEKLKENLINAPQPSLFIDDIVKKVEIELTRITEEFIAGTIPIPRINILQSDNVESGFHDFNLETDGLNYQPVSEEIIRKTLTTNEDEVLHSETKGLEHDKPENVIINELVNFPEIDYDRNNGEEAKLLYKLAGQVIEKLSRNAKGEDLDHIIIYYKRDISKLIYTQMMQNDHFYIKKSDYEVPRVYPFTKIEPHNYSKLTKDSIHHYTETITPTSAIPTKIFTGFKKACHNHYKFDSKTEKDFAAILENDADVLRWLRPAQNQFNLYWSHNSKKYHPDFVVEMKDKIYLVETKKKDDIETTEVQDKARAALEYCKYATEYNLQNKGKEWQYVLIPHDVVLANMGVGALAGRFLYK